MTFFAACKKHPAAFLLPVAALCVIFAPIYPKMFSQWMSDPNYSHGFLVPVISGYFVWQVWPELKETPLRPSNAGFPLLVFGIALLLAGITVNELYSSRSSLICILGGIILTLCGWRIFALLALPLAFLFFMVPLPYTIYDALALPLRDLVSLLSTEGLKFCNIPVLREGNVIVLPNITLEVVEACSGMRSLVSLVALGVAYAFIFLKGAGRRAALIVATVPIAVMTNVVRVFVTGVLARKYGSAAAEGFFHDFAGLAVFVTAMALTFLTGRLLLLPPFGDKGNRHEN